MTDPDGGPHLRPGHPYPAMPTGVRICDDEAALNHWFFYRDRQLIVHADDLDAVREGLERLRRQGPPDDEGRFYRVVRSTADSSLVLLVFAPRAEFDTIDAFRALRFGVVRDASGESLDIGPRRVWPNHVVGVQSHTKWGAGTPPRPRGPLSALPVGDNLPGAKVRVGVLDTGIEPQDWFRGQWSPADARSPLQVTDDWSGATTLGYQAGHGSFVAGTVLQHAPGAHLVIDRPDDPEAGCTDDWTLHERLAALVNRANQLDVLNLSFGGPTAGGEPLPGVCGVLNAAQDAYPELVVVASAGNDGLPWPIWPAALARVIGVGAVATAGGRWVQSNFGEWVNAWSLGEDLSSTFLHWPPDGSGELAQGPMETPTTPQRFEGWAVWSGTSFAAARVTGAIAAELKRDGRSPRQVAFDLVENAATPFENGGLVTPATYVT